MKEGKSSYYLEVNGDIKARQFLFGLPSIVLLSSQGLDTQHSHRGSQSMDSEAGNPSLALGGVSSLPPQDFCMLQPEKVCLQAE